MKLTKKELMDFIKDCVAEEIAAMKESEEEVEEVEVEEEAAKVTEARKCCGRNCKRHAEEKVAEAYEDYADEDDFELILDRVIVRLGNCNPIFSSEIRSMIAVPEIRRMSDKELARLIRRQGYVVVEDDVVDRADKHVGFAVVLGVDDDNDRFSFGE